MNFEFGFRNRHLGIREVDSGGAIDTATRLVAKATSLSHCTRS